MCICAVAYQPRNQRLVGEKEVVGGGTVVGGGSSRYCVYMHIGREASYLLQGVSSPLVLELSPFSNIPSPKLSNEKPGLRIPWPDRPTNRPTSPPSRPLSLASVHRTVIFGQNRTVSYLNVSLGARPPLFPHSFHRRSEAICTPFFNEGRPSPPTPRLLSMEKWKPFPRFPGFPLSLYLSYSLSFGKEEGREDFFLGFVSRREEKRERKRVW